MVDNKKSNFESFLVSKPTARDKHPKLGCVWYNLEVDPSKNKDYVDYLGQSIKDAYVDPQYLARVMNNQGFDGVAEYLKEKLPKKRGFFDVRKGDFGEVLGHVALIDLFNYSVPVFKLRYKTNPQKAVFGIDIIAFRIDENDPKKDVVVFGEVKTSKQRNYGVKDVFDEINLLTKNNLKAKQKMRNAVRFIAERIFIETKDINLEDRINRFLNCYKKPSYIEAFYPFLVRDKSTWHPSALDSMVALKPSRTVLCIITVDDLENVINDVYRRAAQAE